MRRVLIIALALLFACRTVPKSQIQDIDVPPGLTAQQVEFAILVSLADQPPPDDLGPGAEITDRALKAWFGWRYQSIREAQGDWFLEGREPGMILAGLQRRSHYLRLALHYSASQIRFEILDSRNLDETETMIHQAAAQWIQDLEIEVRRALGQLSTH